jgi:hypothetical protein
MKGLWVYTLHRVDRMKLYKKSAAAVNSDTEKLSTMPYMPIPAGKHNA